MYKILLLVSLIILFILYYKYFFSYSYKCKITEESFKIQNKKLNTYREVISYVNLTGNKKRFLRNLNINKDLQKWFLEKTKDQSCIREFAIGVDNNIQKIYFLKDELAFGYKLDTKNNNLEKCVYYPVDNVPEVYLDFMSIDQFNKINNLLPLINENTIYFNVILMDNTELLKSMYIDLPLDLNIKLNDERLKETIRILGHYTDEINTFLENNSNKKISFLCFGKNNKFFSLYYLDEKNNKIKMSLNS